MERTTPCKTCSRVAGSMEDSSIAEDGLQTSGCCKYRHQHDAITDLENDFQKNTQGINNRNAQPAPATPAYSINGDPSGTSVK